MAVVLVVLVLLCKYVAGKPVPLHRHTHAYITQVSTVHTQKDTNEMHRHSSQQCCNHRQHTPTLHEQRHSHRQCAQCASLQGME